MERAAPTGTVAIVFTDVQGSTQLWERREESMRRALAIHDRILRESIAAADGYEVKTEGDAFMASFRSSFAAARFCLASQTALLSADWPAEILEDGLAAEERGPDGLPIRRGLRVRMGIHAGEPECRENELSGRMDYYGPMVNRAARISAAAHGGQILVSERVWNEIRERLPELGDPAPTPLGVHRLKDIETPERLVQLVPAAVRGRTFPPIKTIDLPTTNLPPETSGFVGRAADLEAVERLFERGERLVTLLGPGGTGKTRLSLRFGRVHLDGYSREGGGVWFCDLTEARSLDGVCAAVGRALGLSLTTGKTSDDLVTQIGHALAGRGRVLVLLDNFEQIVVHAAATVGRWREFAPEARFLVSSQERLKLPGECGHELLPLSLPSDGAVADSEAVQLFVQRATAIRPGFVLGPADEAAVAEIVRQLDGIPLAIELAAARIGVLPPAKILERLPRRFDLLVGARRDASSRQATLRGAIDWSWALLSPAEQDAFAQASVFQGGFSIDAAEAVLDLSAHDGSPWPLDVVQALRDRSLLRAWEPPDLPGELRFGMYTSIREYAAEKLRNSGRETDVRRRHAAHYLEAGTAWAEGVEVHGGLERLRRLALDLENLLAVLRDAAAEKPPTADSATRALRALVAVDPVLSTRGPFGTHLSLLDEGIAAADAASPVDPRLHARVLGLRGWAHRLRGQADQATADLERALAMARGAGDRAMEALALDRLGFVEYQRGHMDGAQARLDESARIAREAGLEQVESQALGFLGIVAGDTGQPEIGRANFVAGLSLARKVGNRRQEGVLLANLGRLHAQQGRSSDALAAFKQALAIYREIGERALEGNTLGRMGNLLHDQGTLDEALLFYEKAMAIQREVGNRWAHAIFQASVAQVHHELGNVESAREAYDRALALSSDVGSDRSRAYYRGCLGALFAQSGDIENAERCFQDADRLLAGTREARYRVVIDVLRASLEDARARRAAESGDRVHEERHRRAADAFASQAHGRAGATDGTPRTHYEISEDVRIALRLARRERSDRGTGPR